MTPSDYVSGTITLTNGSAAFTGTGTGWLAAGFREGDTLVYIAGGESFMPPIIATITSDTAGTLTAPWTGPTLTAVAYRIRYQWDSSRVSAQSRQLIEQLGNGNITSFSALEGPGVPVFSGPHALTIKPEADFINGVAYNVQVNTLADRAAYDGQAANFAVLVSDIGDGRSAVYSKKSNASGDWTDPAYITGPVGDTGPYTELTFGSVTTVPYGTPASVNVVVIDPDTVRLDFSIPAGQDGKGTGDVTGPSGAVDLHIAVFDGNSGKLIKDGGKTIDEIVPGNNSITNAILADMDAATIKGRAAGTGNGDPVDLTSAQVYAILQTVTGILHVQDRKVGALGGNFATGAWRTRDLNTVVINTIPGASLDTATGQLTLPAGKYVVGGLGAPAFQVNRHRARLFNVTTGLNLVTGVNEYASGPGQGQSRSAMSGIFELVATSVLRVEHQCETTNSAGFGLSDGFGDINIYTDLMIARVP